TRVGAAPRIGEATRARRAAAAFVGNGRVLRTDVLDRPAGDGAKAGDRATRRGSESGKRKPDTEKNSGCWNGKWSYRAESGREVSWSEGFRRGYFGRRAGARTRKCKPAWPQRPNRLSGRGFAREFR